MNSGSFAQCTVHIKLQKLIGYVQLRDKFENTRPVTDLYAADTAKNLISY